MKIWVLLIAAMAFSHPAHSVPIDVASDAYPHFANFANDSPAGALSRISASEGPTNVQDFGWHSSPSGPFPEIAGIVLPASEIVTTLRLQVHSNPFSDFTFQGSNDTTTGLDGTWADLLIENVPSGVGDFDWVEYPVANATAYSAYRISAAGDYAGGWAMFRWDLLTVPEPSAAVLFASALVGLAFVAAGRRGTGKVRSRSLPKAGPALGARLKAIWALGGLRCSALALGILVGVATSNNATAALTEVDLFVAGDALLTRDSATGLDWLDLDQTLNQSVNDILGGAGGWAALGFVHATQAQVLVLYQDAGIPDIDVSATVANFVPVTNLIALLGQTGGTTAPFSQGLAGVDEPSLGSSHLPGIQAFPDSGTGFADTSAGSTLNSSVINGAGNFLIRPMPEPPPFILLALGLVGPLGLASVAQPRQGRFSRP